MSYGGYNPYSDNGGGRGYGADPFDDRNAMQYGGNHEMSSFSPGNTPQMGQQGYGSPRAQNQTSVLDECTDIHNAIQNVETQLGVLSGLQKRALDDADMTSGSNTKRELDNLTQSIMDQYRALTDRVKLVKSNPDSRHPRNVAQVNKTDRDLRKAIQKFQELEAASRKDMQARVERQARIVHPDATEAEIAEIVNSDTQIFQQAVMGSRAEHANRVLGAVKQRHQEMLKIEQDLMQLLELLNDMSELLAKQEVTVMAIDTHAEHAAEDMVKANVELETAVTTAKGTRKKKWICLGICVTIVVIIVVAVVAYIMVNRAANGGGGGGGDNNDNQNAKKRGLFQRDVMDDLQMNTARAVEIAPGAAATRPRARLPAPGLSSSRRLSRRGVDNVQGTGLAPRDVVETVAKRFVVDWKGADTTGSDD